jgi:Holliday junction DNA helicase RuvA
LIAQIRGVVLHRTASELIVDVHGIGMRATCTPRALAMSSPGKEVQLQTALIVREDAWQLFGFADSLERNAFQMLLSVSGIGPRIALAAISTLEPERLGAAIVAGDVALLTKIPGIGRKGAERMCVELRDKFASFAAPAPAGWQVAVVDALVGLGWNSSQAETAVSKVAADLGEPEVSVALRAALQSLGRR